MGPHRPSASASHMGSQRRNLEPPEQSSSPLAQLFLGWKPTQLTSAHPVLLCPSPRACLQSFPAPAPSPQLSIALVAHSAPACFWQGWVGKGVPRSFHPKSPGALSFQDENLDGLALGAKAQVSVQIPLLASYAALVT